MMSGLLYISQTKNSTLKVFWFLLALCGSVKSIRFTSTDMPIGGLNSGKCRLIINELNIFPAGIDQFLELKKVCNLDFKLEKQFPVNLKYYKVIFISHDGHLLAACHLDGKVKPKTKGGNIFFTLAENAENLPDIKITEACNFPPDELGHVHRQLPTGEHAPVAVALIYSAESDSIKDIDLLADNIGGYFKTAIDSRMEKKIRENLHDIQLYTSSSPFTSCEYFKRFYESSEYQTKIIRDWGQLYHQTQRSLSRCPEPIEPPTIEHVLPFQASYFVYAPMTPGKENQCKDSFRFEVEAEQPLRKKIRTSFEKGYECHITTDDPAIDNLFMISSPIHYSDRLKELIADFQGRRQDVAPSNTAEFVVNPVDDISYDCQPPALELRLEPLLPFSKQPLPQEEFEEKLASQQPLLLQTCDQFEHKELITTLKAMKDPPIFWQDILNEETCSWLDWLPSHVFRCKYCNQLLSQGVVRDRPGSPLITKIMTVGQINKGKQAKTENRKLLKRHLENPIHRISLDYVSLFENGLRGDELWREFTRTNGPLRRYTNATENLFAMVFTIVDLDSSFHKSTKLRALLDYYGVNTGHVYNNPMGTWRLLSFISQTLHANLLQHLKQNSPEFSLLIDSSTDVASIPALAIVIQTFDEAKELKIYLYKVIWINGRETGEQLWQHFLREIKNDGLEDFVRQKCVGFASDGGSNVLAFREYLKKFTDHGDRMVLVHCFAHKSERAMVHAWKDKPYVLETEDIVVKLHRIFGCRSAKKKQHLQVVQEELGDSRFSLKRIQKTRWVNSRLRAIDPIIIHWKTIMKALQRVYDDSTIKDPKQQQLVKDTMDKLKDANFLVTAAFVIDVYTALSGMSLKLQDRGSSLIGKKEVREKLKASLVDLKTHDGPFLQSILENSKFSSPSLSGKQMTVQNFELGNVYHNGIAMNKPSGAPIATRLSDSRAEYIELLIKQLDVYFPVDPTDNFDIFDPSHWPVSESIQQYGNDEIALMNKELKWNFAESQIIEEWISLKSEVKNHPKFERNRRELSPEDFWTFYLRDSTIRWSDSLQTILTNVITVPASTAEVERIFSYYTQIKTMRRFNLNVATVDSLIRIRFNGPKSISEFDPFPYTWGFIEKHSRADDTSIPARRLPKTNAIDSSDLSSDTVVSNTVPVRATGAVERSGSEEADEQDNPDLDTNWNPLSTCTDHVQPLAVAPPETSMCLNYADENYAINEIMALIESEDEESEVLV